MKSSRAGLLVLGLLAGCTAARVGSEPPPPGSTWRRVTSCQQTSLGRFTMEPGRIDETELRSRVEERALLAFHGTEGAGVSILRVTYEPTEVGSEVVRSNTPLIPVGLRVSAHPLASRSLEFRIADPRSIRLDPAFEPATHAESISAAAWHLDPLFEFGAVVAGRDLHPGDVIALPPPLALRLCWTALATIEQASEDSAAGKTARPDFLKEARDELAELERDASSLLEGLRSEARFESFAESDGERVARFGIEILAPGSGPPVVVKRGEVTEVGSGEARLTGTVDVSLRHGWIVRESLTMTMVHGDGITPLPPDEPDRPVFGWVDRTTLERSLERVR